MPSPGAAHSELLWGVNDRFVSYVGRLPDGACSVGAGTRVEEGPVFVFSADPHPAPARTHTGFTGQVRFYGHAGALQVTLSNPILHSDPAVLSVAVGAAVNGAEPRMIIATLAEVTRNSTGETVTAVPELTQAGVELFGDIYPVGFRMSPLQVRPAPPVSEASVSDQIPTSASASASASA